MSSKDGVSRTLFMAFALCLVCSIIVSAAAVMLKPLQEANKTLDRKRNILAAAGMLDESKTIDEQFAQISTRVVDLRTGKFSDAVDPEKYNQKKAAKDPGQSEKLTADQDLAKIARRENYAVVYLVESEPDQFDKIILPVRGYGLWSTLYGFVALEADGNTIAGMGFYEHGETPGLGGEVDNPRWKALWPGKQVYKDESVKIGLIKGPVNPQGADALWQVDGLSGATLTSTGVTRLVQFWLGEDGFQEFLNNLKSGEV